MNLRYRYELFNAKDIDEIVLSDFEVIFSGRSTITNFEMFEFQMIKLLALISRKDIDELQAQNLIIDDLSLRDDYLEFIGSTMMLAKINQLKEYIELFLFQNRN